MHGAAAGRSSGRRPSQSPRRRRSRCTNGAAGTGTARSTCSPSWKASSGRGDALRRLRAVRLAALGEDDWRADNPAHVQTNRRGPHIRTGAGVAYLYRSLANAASMLARWRRPSRSPPTSKVIERPPLRRPGPHGAATGSASSVASPTPGGRAARRRRCWRDRLHTLPSWPRSRWRSRACKTPSVAERAPPGTTPTSWLTTRDAYRSGRIRVRGTRSSAPSCRTWPRDHRRGREYQGLERCRDGLGRSAG